MKNGDGGDDDPMNVSDDAHRLTSGDDGGDDDV